MLPIIEKSCGCTQTQESRNQGVRPTWHRHPTGSDYENPGILLSWVG